MESWSSILDSQTNIDDVMECRGRVFLTKKASAKTGKSLAVSLSSGAKAHVYVCLGVVGVREARDGTGEHQVRCDPVLRSEWEGAAQGRCFFPCRSCDEVSEMLMRGQRDSEREAALLRYFNPRLVQLQKKKEKKLHVDGVATTPVLVSAAGRSAALPAPPQLPSAACGPPEKAQHLSAHSARPNGRSQRPS